MKYAHRTLIHRGGIVGEANVQRDKAASHLANVTGVARLAADFFAKGGGVFYYASSGHVYGQTSKDGALESDLPSPQSLYAEQKLSGEDGLRAIANDFGGKAVALRIFSVLGNEMPRFSLMGAINAGIRGESKISNPDDLRDFLSPAQAARVIIKISKVSSDKSFEVINVCTGIPTSIREASRIIAEAGGQVLRSDSFVGTTSTLPILVGDTSKLFNRVGLEALPWDPYSQH
jgi:nucleoside-diphosphate-sugar epimerase